VEIYLHSTLVNYDIYFTVLLRSSDLHQVQAVIFEDFPSVPKVISPLKPRGNFIYLTFVYLLIYSKGQSHSCEANGFAARQETPRILLNPKVHYRSPRCPQPVSSLSQLNLVHTPHHASRSSALILSSHLRFVLPSGLLPSLFPPKPCIRCLPFPIRATCPTHMIHLQFITR
jgi:hypothetical protein